MATEDAGNPVWETIKTVVYALLIAGVFRSFIFQPFYIPSGSMKDTLLIGDFLFVNKMAYGYSSFSCEIPIVGRSFCPFIEGRVFGSEPEQGDVVVFSHPTTGEDFIKRVIGLPGDRVRVENGVLYINDVAATQERVEDFVEIYEPQGAQGRFPLCSNSPRNAGDDCIKDRFIETLPNGHTHFILNALVYGPEDRRGFDYTGEFVVPEGHVFVMGDNRDNSRDSREPQHAGGVGFVPMENIVGRADRVIFSAEGSRIIYFWTWRSDRFFQAVE